MKGNKSCPICPITVVLSFAAYIGMGYLIHNVLLMDSYKATSELWATQGFMEKNLYYYYIGAFIFSLFATIVFKKGYEGGGIGEGVRFGIYFGAAVGALHISMYPFNKYPIEFAYAWAFGDVLQAIVMGIVLAALFEARCKGSSCSVGMCGTESCEVPAPAAKKPSAKKPAKKKK